MFPVLFRVHASCPSFLDLAMQRPDGDFLPGATDVVLLDTDDGDDSSLPLEGLFTADSCGDTVPAAAACDPFASYYDFGRIGVTAPLRIPSGTNHHHHHPAQQLLSRTASPMHSMQSSPSGQSLALAASLQSNGTVGCPQQQRFADQADAVAAMDALPDAALVHGSAEAAARRVTARQRRATIAPSLDALEAAQKGGKKRGSGTQAGKLAPNPNGHSCTACGAQVCVMGKD